MITNSKKAMMVTGVFLLGLLAAAWPAVGFAQDANEPAVTDVDANAALPEDMALTEPASEPTSTRSVEGWDDYAIVANFNMFSNVRGRPVSRDRDQDRPPAKPAEPETQYVLRGVTAENGTLAAYFDYSQGQGRWVHLGEEVCRGKITSLTLDQVVYERSDVNTVPATIVALGQDLEGTAQGATYSTRTVRSAASTTPTRQQRDTRRNTTDIRSMIEELGGAGMSDMIEVFTGGMGGMGDMNGGFSRRGGRGSRGGFGGGMDMAGGNTQQATPAPAPAATRSAEEIARLEQEMMARRQQQTDN